MKNSFEYFALERSSAILTIVLTDEKEKGEIRFFDNKLIMNNNEAFTLKRKVDFVQKLNTRFLVLRAFQGEETDPLGFQT